MLNRNAAFMICRLTVAAFVLTIASFESTLAAEPVEPSQSAAAPNAGDKSSRDGKQKDSQKWISLFDGKSLKGWKSSDFYGKGEVKAKDGTIVIGKGNDMTGITIDRKIPQVNYVFELEAMRVDGSDFFCGLTFPVKEEFCSLIVGGWGGGVIGLSSLNGFDASENETTTYREFKNNTWYPIKLQVTDQRITAWIDGKEMVDADIRNAELDTRLEVEWSKPFGLATWNTTAAVRKLRIRELTPTEVKAFNAGLPDE